MSKTGSIFLALYLAGCVYDPVYEGTHCGPGSTCPEGYICDDTTKICTKSSTEAASNDGQDAGEDAGQADDSNITDQILDAGSDENGDTQNATPDEGDLQDGQGNDDAADESPADQDPCGGCGPGHWCDESGNSCKPCNDLTHCGTSCQPCDDGQTCSNVGDGGFCCLGACDFSTACKRQQCDSSTLICKASFNPLSYSWVELSDGSALFCALSDQDGIVAGADQCDPDDSNYLLVFCPWGGTCGDDQQCAPDVSYGTPHLCGPSFGCDTDHCRMHYQNGVSCQFNFDCESFCCQRGDNPTCASPDGTRSNCRLSTTFYKEGATKYSWHTLPQNSDTDPHDISAWWWSHNSEHPAEECSTDSDCDTGDCHDFSGIGNRCRFPNCMPNTEADTIRSHYFCNSNELDHTGHINVVTNQDPYPTETPPHCVYSE